MYGSWRALRVVALGLFGMATPVAAHAQPLGDRSGEFDPTSATSLRVVEAALGRTSTRMDLQRLEVDLADAAHTKALLLPNPTLDLGWGTVPVGETNPAGLRAPLANVPNYSVGVAYTFELGKRAPRQAWTAALQRVSRAELSAQKRQAALELLEVIGELARATLRLQSTGALADTGARALEVARSRFAQGFGSGLEVDRLELEVARARQQMTAVRAQIDKARSACTQLLGAGCGAFDDGSGARVFLDHWIALDVSRRGELRRRPDVYAIEQQRMAAEREAELARGLALPDPTVRLGYMHDRFVAAGNQLNSLNLSVSASIPIFDRGQAETQAARARARQLAEHRARLLRIAAARGPHLRARLSAARARLAELSTDLIPRATQMLVQVAQAAEGRLVSITDVIQAHRALGELVLEEADGYADAYTTALELLAELPPPAVEQGVKP